MDDVATIVPDECPHSGDIAKMLRKVDKIERALAGDTDDDSEFRPSNGLIGRVQNLEKIARSSLWVLLAIATPLCAFVAMRILEFLGVIHAATGGTQ